jgi:hypothetical protein
MALLRERDESINRGLNGGDDAIGGVDVILRYEFPDGVASASGWKEYPVISGRLGE